MNTFELVKYYADLLILQYIGKPRAYATVGAQVTPVLMAQDTVQTVNISPSPEQGAYTLSYNDIEITINWDDTLEEIQSLMVSSWGLADLVLTGTTTAYSFPVPLGSVVALVSSTLETASNEVEAYTQADHSFYNDLLTILAPNLVLGQILTATGSAQLVKARLWVKRAGGAVGNITLDLRAWDWGGGQPGAVVASSNVVDVSTLSTVGDDFDFIFPTLPMLTNGEPFTLSINNTQTGGMIQFGNALTGGGFTQSTDNGASWSPSTESLYFRVFVLEAGDPITPTVTESISPTLPLAVQDGYNVLGDSPAVGDQLDVLGQYAGVARSGLGFTQNITLNDADFLSLIKMAIVGNSLGSSLSDIQNFIQTYFPDGQMYVFDYQTMQMSYLLSTSIGSQDLMELFVTQGLLPKPMGVGVSAIYAPIITEFFGFVSYADDTNPLVNPFNDYDNYETDWPFISYENGVI